ncbi:TIGR03086 family metal-binding protein [Paractinoplanes lichenicola]|uniref:TIGR03086 family protein n=1 Tax=Paractinoplanes lichenicola TaxID=2802976 RepID=A0ABS1VM52_9ACTN|nr:TIGR03086 family metal-binding protein [Actinoplanes lichenicola]MBL7255806.1 TIGR03086 family protein [Actinoplanes lichenicola]
MLTIEIDARPLDAAAVHTTTDLVSRITDADLTSPTPCEGWDLAALLTHMTDQHYVFATAAGASPAAASHAPASAAPASTAHATSGPTAGSASLYALGLSRELIRRYEESARAVIAAFAAVDDLDTPFWIPEFGRSVPGRLAVGFHLVDYVVHGWDVARTLDIAYAPDPDALALALAVARAVPDGPERLAPGSPFAPALPTPADADPLTETLLLLGRDPSSPVK